MQFIDIVVNENNITWSDPNAALFFVTTLPLVEKHRSDGTDVARAHNHLRAIGASDGNFKRWLFQKVITSYDFWFGLAFHFFNSSFAFFTYMSQSVAMAFLPLPLSLDSYSPSSPKRVVIEFLNEAKKKVHEEMERF